MNKFLAKGLDAATDGLVNADDINAITQAQGKKDKAKKALSKGAGKLIGMGTGGLITGEDIENYRKSGSAKKALMQKNLVPLAARAASAVMPFAAPAFMVAERFMPSISAADIANKTKQFRDTKGNVKDKVKSLFKKAAENETEPEASEADAGLGEMAGRDADASGAQPKMAEGGEGGGAGDLGGAGEGGGAGIPTGSKKPKKAPSSNVPKAAQPDSSASKGDRAKMNELNASRESGGGGKGKSPAKGKMNKIKAAKKVMGKAPGGKQTSEVLEKVFDVLSFIGAPFFEGMSWSWINMKLSEGANKKNIRLVILLIIWIPTVYIVILSIILVIIDAAIPDVFNPLIKVVI